MKKQFTGDFWEASTDKKEIEAYDKHGSYLTNVACFEENIANDADARLIISAPEMYDLLKIFAYGEPDFDTYTDAKKLLKRIDGNNTNDYSNSNYEKIIKKFRYEKEVYDEVIKTNSELIEQIFYAGNVWNEANLDDDDQRRQDAKEIMQELIQILFNQAEYDKNFSEPTKFDLDRNSIDYQLSIAKHAEIIAGNYQRTYDNTGYDEIKIMATAFNALATYTKKISDYAYEVPESIFNDFCETIADCN